MTKADKIRVLVAYRMEQASDALQAARTLIDAGLPRDAVNRAYYAMFYAVLALLITRGLGPSSHSGSLTLFSREFVKTGLLSPEMAKLAQRAFDQRLEADYAEMVAFSTEDVEDTLAQAQTFVDRVAELLPDLLPEGDS